MKVMSTEDRAREIVNKVEALAWADNWTTYKAVPYVVEQLEAETQALRSLAADMAQALEKAKVKLEIYRANSNGEYQGGPEYQSLRGQISSTLAKWKAAMGEGESK